MICIKDWNDFQSFFVEKRAKKYTKRATLPYMVITKYGND